MMDQIILYIDQNLPLVISILMIALVVARAIGRKLQHTSKGHAHDGKAHFSSEGHKTRLK